MFFAAVELSSQGVIEKRVDELESWFMIALDYMIQLADKDQGDQRKSLLEIIRQTILDHFTKKYPQHIESRLRVPDRKLLVRLVLIREEVSDMMGSGILDESTMPEAEECNRS
ncbi:hypothetical protein ZOSMA_58G00800 [Zostera marina]|uniref:Uncharacterized protein n=1 Tax=Zostera marina TaxID=29655 RepID=A0A0K9NX75_ZOSMR|nr:hypothetical protein ZOSMA_58G00800 [Zostera marina]